MTIQKTEMLCLNTTIIRKAENAEDQLAGLTIVKKDPGEATVIMRVDNFVLSDDQATQIKAIHERATAELEAVLSW